MKVVSVQECKASLSSYLSQSQAQQVLVTKHGKPVSVMIGVQGLELEDVLWGTDERLWSMLERRRRACADRLSLEQVRRRFEKMEREEKQD